MSDGKPASDALVFFGATGDLAYKKIFPALQQLVKRGKLDSPVIGVAKSGWNHDQLLDRAKKSITEYGGIDEEAFPKLWDEQPNTAIELLRRGKVDFVLSGFKLRGRFALIETERRHGARNYETILFRAD